MFEEKCLWYFKKMNTEKECGAGFFKSILDDLRFMSKSELGRNLHDIAQF